MFEPSFLLTKEITPFKDPIAAYMSHIYDFISSTFVCVVHNNLSFMYEPGNYRWKIGCELCDGFIFVNNEEIDFNERAYEAAWLIKDRIGNKFNFIRILKHDNDFIFEVDFSKQKYCNLEDITKKNEGLLLFYQAKSIRRRN